MAWLWWTLGIVGVLLALLVILGLILSYFESKQKRRVLTEGEHTTGWLVQANNSLFEPGTLDLPAMVVISPDPETARDKDFMTELAERIFNLKGHDPDECGDKEDAFVAALMADERYIQGKKDRLPKRFAEGRTVYLAHIMIFRDDLPGKKLSGRRVPCAVVWDDDKQPIVSRPLTAEEYL
jgi:hypothetical protein